MIDVGFRTALAAGLAVGVLALGTLGAPGAVSAEEAPDADDPGRDVGEVELSQEFESTATAPAITDPLRSLQWYLDRIRAPGAWDVTFGDPDITVAVIDTGVDAAHPDLSGAFWADQLRGANGFDHLTGNDITYVSPEEDWHGTAVAGVVGARTGDGYGMVGVAPEVSLMVRRIYASESTETPPFQTSYDAAIEAIDAAVANGADVLLITWGGTFPDSRLERAIRRARVPVVVAAGNDGQDLSDAPLIARYPAMYRLPNMVTVAASDRDNRIAVGQTASNYGPRHVDIAAPGVDIVSLRAGGEHGVFDGTSFAAPQVAAALALGRSIAPRTSTNELVGALIGTARTSSALRGRVASGGVLDIGSFLAAVERPVCTGSEPPSAFVDVSRTSVHVAGIDCVKWYEVALGVDAERFLPDRTLTRGEMAAFLTRVLDRAGYQPPEELTAPFVDTEGTTHEASIAVIADAGIAGGVGDGRFAPAATVTRAQMATFLVNTVALLTEQELVAQQEWFDDTSDSVHAGSIGLVRELGITLGTQDPRIYDPATGLTRAQMATFLARTLDVLAREGVTITHPTA